MSVAPRKPRNRPAKGYLHTLYDALQSGQDLPAGSTYRLPSLWGDPYAPPSTISVRPFGHYAGIIESMVDGERTPLDTGEGDAGGGEWSRTAVVYNMMIRTSAAFDHDGDGAITLPSNPGGWRENGTFLKAIAMIPYIRSLGVNTIHLLPVQEIGLDGRRGNMGSVYAIRDLLSFDTALSEPNLGMHPREEFLAFVEAAHISGLRVVLELPLRTASKDCVWVKDHPEWFYWIPKGVKFRPPHFPEKALRLAEEKIKQHDLTGLPAPPPEYINLFTDPPPSASIRLEGEHFAGRLPDGREVVVPGAFADWPPNDPQPVWDDITYLKYYQDGAHNYISYNTVRMYESSLLEGSSVTESLWTELSRIITTLVSEYGIDGIMIDMAHALPVALTRRIIESARTVTPHACFWAEDFDRSEEQKEEGFNAVLGAQWYIQHEPDKFRVMLKWISETPQFPPHLASPETHNTRRAADRPGGKKYGVYAWAISNFIPAIPYLHSGLELAETRPANTGVGFTASELKHYHADTLPLFSAAQFEWESDPGTLDLIRNVIMVRNRYRDSCVPLPGTTFTLLDAGDSAVLAFRRVSPTGKNPFIVVGNSDMEQTRHFRIQIGSGEAPFRDELAGGKFDASGGILEGDLVPGQVLFLVDRIPAP